ncbi:MAG TPA: tetraacyldisaccharide 4'-kinase [Rhodospirillaceae bacterium]|nr:tetraacyldisaccharide 4'-kinase [Rhodospirillaceae bacterium]MAX64670.1 tetraacyldisaccharide 4'-kinase [Rhodospirillaceae bacterium]MBB58642.1 tetraacyldisaccharide 4'-kinase [Rhodospirillaceae bacterium]HBM12722.1 tetraacyldisaccharide 4'-kinase [Rhodospirillaceae bacterium]|tara:strand:- start:19363 stop:20352 length:990 start_codon:yes stop_codon:yes gene_type:complete
MHAPGFWSHSDPGILSRVLWPASLIWSGLSALRQRYATPTEMNIPVYCIGNVTLGGAGKTPVALDLAQRLIGQGAQPHFLSRGYGGSAAGPLRVDPNQHGAAQVGDEPLLLARIAPTWIGADRVASAHMAQKAGATHLIMDDGFQNPGLHKTASLLVVDGAVGFGNGFVFPAGPLREPVAAALARTNAVLILGDQAAPHLKRDLSGFHGPILSVHIVADRPKALPIGTKCIAFAGIGRPEKFFATLRGLDLDLLLTQEFPDHHPFSAQDMTALEKQATMLGGVLVTTEKDAIRLPAAFRSQVISVPITLDWPPSVDPLSLLTQGRADVV